MRKWEDGIPGFWRVNCRVTCCTFEKVQFPGKVPRSVQCQYPAASLQAGMFLVRIGSDGRHAQLSC